MLSADPDILTPAVSLRYRLQFRVMLLVLAMVVATVGTSNWMLKTLIEKQLDETLSRETVRIGEHLAGEFREVLQNREGKAIEERLEQAASEPGIALVQVEDRFGNVLGLRRNSAELHAEFESRFGAPGGQSALAQSRPTPLESKRAPEARVLRMPILTASRLGGAPDLLGHVAFVHTDPVHRATVERLRALAIGVVLVACLISVPLTALLMRRLTRPLRRILRAVTLLASGETLPRLPVKREDELGLLARSVTETAATLARARAELLRANESLERDVAKRTAELHAANRRLELEIETKNEFLRTVSHDLNAPLRNIAGMTTMLQRRFGDALPDEVKHRLERIAANVKIETSMLDDLLELSRIRTRPGECEDVNLHELVRGIVEALSHDLAERSIECAIATTLPVVRVESNLARQVFLNLIDNAAKYMGQRETRRITIAHEVRDGRLCVSVSDTGPGISESDRKRIFQVFRRGSGAAAASVPGRGIGLASVKAVVEHWGGEITLTSEVGAGSTFTVSIPASRIASADVGPAAERTAA